MEQERKWERERQMERQMELRMENGAADEDKNWGAGAWATLMRVQVEGGGVVGDGVKTIVGIETTYWM